MSTREQVDVRAVAKAIFGVLMLSTSTIALCAVLYQLGGWVAAGIIPLTVLGMLGWRLATVPAAGNGPGSGNGPGTEGFMAFDPEDEDAGIPRY